jgi:nicotinate-nucleotide pyrophosphorylase (carboxylating)
LLRAGWQHQRADGWPPAGDAVLEAVRSDGQRVFPGDIVATVQGPAALVLAAERTALNFLQRMSCVATATRAYVDSVDRAAPGSGVEVLDTRKTTPGLRHLDRYAVRCGGGRNHRFGLHDVAMVKDNHVDASGGIAAAVASLRAVHPSVQVVVEARTIAEVRDALAANVDVVLLDNMDPDLLRAAVALARGGGGSGADGQPGLGAMTTLEASGGITLDTVGAVAQTGIDRISIGAITHSAPALDLALDLQPLHTA